MPTKTLQVLLAITLQISPLKPVWFKKNPISHYVGVTNARFPVYRLQEQA